MVQPQDDEKKIETEEQPQDDIEKQQVKAAKAPASSASGRNGIVLALVLLALALVVGIPLGLMNNNNNNKKDKEEENNLSNSNAEERNSTRTSRQRLPAVSIDTLRDTYETCAVLSYDLKLAARMMANQTITSNAKSYFHRSITPYFGGPAILESVGSPPMMMATMTDTVSTGVGNKQVGDISTTESSFGSNNQEEGVEEPDILQSDGEYVYAAYGKEIIKMSVEDASITSRTDVGAREDEDEKCSFYNAISNMLLIDDVLVVLSDGYCNTNQVDNYGGGGLIQPKLSIYRPAGQSLTRAIMYNKNTMEFIQEERYQGSYTAARGIGKDIYLVTTKSIDSFEPFLSKLNPWDTSIFGSRTKESNFTEEVYTEQAWEQVDKYIDGFVQGIIDNHANGDCSSIQRLALFQNDEESSPPFGDGILNSIASVTGFNVDQPSVSKTKSLILPTSGWQVYASQTQLVLATQGWWFGDGASQETYVITYELDNAEASVQGFGTVPGYVLNQFSIDHQQKNGKDYLFFATTTQQRWSWLFDDMVGIARWEPRQESTSQVTVLEVPKDGLTAVDQTKMKVVGKVEGLGKPGEQIYSVRFQKDRCFVVTFERIDPFYTIDLTDPEDPKKVGELEIPGFSSYLHPIGDDLILGVGQYVDPVTERQEGLQISIFNVTDFANPTRTHVFTENSGDGSGSAAEYNHMAFRYLDESGLLILPVSIHDWNRDMKDERPFNGFKVYQATAEDGINEYFQVNHETQDYYFHRWCWINDQGNLQPRSLVFDGVLWTMKGNAVQFSDLSSRVTEAKPIDLDEGTNKTIQCNEPYFSEPIPLLLPEILVDCSAVSCVIPECEDFAEPETLEGECCPMCPPVEESSTEEDGSLEILVEDVDDCSRVRCAMPTCDNDVEPFTPEGQCCLACPEEEATTVTSPP